MLVYRSECVLQVLEGEEASVRRLFAKIEVDVRHRQVTLLFVWPIEERSFPRWSMAYRQFELEDPSFVNDYNELLSPSFNLETLGVDRASRMVRAFIAAIR